MLRICLIVAIVAALAALAVSQFKVADKIATTEQDLKDTTEKLQASQKSEAAEKKKARDATAAAEKANEELRTTKEDLAAASAKADQQEKRANDLEVRLNDTTRTKNEAQDKLAKFAAFGMEPDQIRDVIAQNKKLVADSTALVSENRVLDREVARLREELSKYQGEKVKVELPIGLKGKVLAVDPKYEFVVLNIGSDQGVLERGEMLVNRSGKLVAKVRILSVQPNRSIANVLQDWKQAEIMEGDVVLVGL